MKTVFYESPDSKLVLLDTQAICVTSDLGGSTQDYNTQDFDWSGEGYIVD